MGVQTGQDNRYTAPVSDSASRITSLQEHKDIEARMQKKLEIRAAVQLKLLLWSPEERAVKTLLLK